MLMMMGRPTVRDRRRVTRESATGLFEIFALIFLVIISSSIIPVAYAQRYGTSAAEVINSDRSFTLGMDPATEYEIVSVRDCDVESGAVLTINLNTTYEFELNYRMLIHYRIDVRNCRFVQNSALVIRSTGYPDASGTHGRTICRIDIHGCTFSNGMLVLENLHLSVGSTLNLWDTQFVKNGPTASTVLHAVSLGNFLQTAVVGIYAKSLKLDQTSFFKVTQATFTITGTGSQVAACVVFDGDISVANSSRLAITDAVEMTSTTASGASHNILFRKPVVLRMLGCLNISSVKGKSTSSGSKADFTQFLGTLDVGPRTSAIFIGNTLTAAGGSAPFFHFTTGLASPIVIADEGSMGLADSVFSGLGAVMGTSDTTGFNSVGSDYRFIVKCNKYDAVEIPPSLYWSPATFEFAFDVTLFYVCGGDCDETLYCFAPNVDYFDFSTCACYCRPPHWQERVVFNPVCQQEYLVPRGTYSETPSEVVSISPSLEATLTPPPTVTKTKSRSHSVPPTRSPTPSKTPPITESVSLSRSLTPPPTLSPSNTPVWSETPSMGGSKTLTPPGTKTPTISKTTSRTRTRTPELPITTSLSESRSAPTPSTSRSETPPSKTESPPSKSQSPSERSVSPSPNSTLSSSFSVTQSHDVSTSVSDESVTSSFSFNISVTGGEKTPSVSASLSYPSSSVNLTISESLEPSETETITEPTPSIQPTESNSFSKSVPPPPPPFPDVRVRFLMEGVGMDINTAEVVVSAGTVVAAVGGFASPGLAGYGTRFAILPSTLRCGEEEELEDYPYKGDNDFEPVSKYEHPIPLSGGTLGIGTTQAADWAAAAFATSMTVFGLMCVVSLVPAQPPKHQRKPRMLRLTPRRILETFVAVATQYFVPQCIAAFCFVFVVMTAKEMNSGTALLSVTISILVISLAILGKPFVAVGRWFVDHVTCLFDREAREYNLIPIGVHGLVYLEKHGAYVDSTSNGLRIMCRLYFFVELITTTLVAGLAVVRPRKSHCTSMAILVLGVLLLHAVYLVVFRPYRRKAEMFAALVHGCILQPGLMLCVMLARVKREPAITLAAYMWIISACVFGVQLFILFHSLVDSLRSERRVLGLEPKDPKLKQKDGTYLKLPPPPPPPLPGQQQRSTTVGDALAAGGVVRPGSVEREAREASLLTQIGHLGEKRKVKKEKRRRAAVRLRRGATLVKDRSDLMFVYDSPELRREEDRERRNGDGGENSSTSSEFSSSDDGEGSSASTSSDLFRGRGFSGRSGSSSDSSQSSSSADADEAGDGAGGGHVAVEIDRPYGVGGAIDLDRLLDDVERAPPPQRQR